MLKKGKKLCVALRRASEEYGIPPGTLAKWCRVGKVVAYLAYVPGQARPTYIVERGSLEKFLKARRVADLEEVDT